MTAMFLIIAASTLLLSTLLAHHAVHRRWRRCTQRTNTQHQTRFTVSRFYLARRDVVYKSSAKDIVTFDFAAVAPDVLLEIPPGSCWYSIVHANLNDEMRWCLMIISGTWFSGGSRFQPGSRVGPVPLRSWHSFGKDNPVSANAVAVLEMRGSERQRQFYHTLCSAMQDAERYFSLCTTPAWLRLLYAVVCRIMPICVRDAMVQQVLWIQLRAIFWRNDFWEDHGTCRFFGYFYLMRPPRWVQDFEYQSRWVISRTVLRTNYWSATLLLGMSASYPEYALVDGLEKEKPAPTT